MNTCSIMKAYLTSQIRQTPQYLHKPFCCCKLAIEETKPVTSSHCSVSCSGFVRLFSASRFSLIHCATPHSFISRMRWQDFMIMLVHHLATIMLITFSYANNMVRAGTMVMCVHDASDIFLEVRPLSHLTCCTCTWAGSSFTCQIFLYIIKVNRLTCHGRLSTSCQVAKKCRIST